jgi:TonB family protein
LAAPVALFNVLRRGVFRYSVLSFCGAVALLLVPAALNSGRAKAQQTPSAPEPAAQAPSSAATPQPAQTPAPAPQESRPAQPPAAAPAVTVQAPELGSITEDALRKQLEGKDLFLRGGYLDNTLTFNEHGVLIGHSAQGSYTLSGIRINKVRLLKHKVELEGARYGLHFLGALPSEDPTNAVDRVNITPKKKEVRITIDRELVLKPRQQKAREKATPPAAKPAAAAPAATPVQASAATTAPTATAKPDSAASPTASTPATPAASTSTTAPTASAPAPSAATNPATGPAPSAEPSDADEALAEIAAAPAAERPTDAKSVTTTLSPAHANQVLEEALDNVFAQGFDTRMMASMPHFWKLYYEAVAARADYQPSDRDVLRQNMVDKKARLVTTFEPASNQFAQDYGVAGMSEYHVVVGADGKPSEIAVARPIGFGLDESAVEAIRKATFEPAIKDGKPVPVLLNMVFEFRIYSKRTAAESKPAPEQAPEAPSLPGPYSVQH